MRSSSLAAQHTIRHYGFHVFMRQALRQRCGSAGARWSRGVSTAASITTVAHGSELNVLLSHSEILGGGRPARERHAHAEVAAIPLLFAIQQLSEGVIWLTFRYEAPPLNAVMTHVYSFFSHVLWPVYMSMAVLLIEPRGRRRRALLVFVAVGAAVGTYLLYVLAAFPIVSRPTGQHIEYVSPHFFAVVTMMPYLMSTTIGPILSTHRMVKIFGVLALSSFAAAYFFYATWFISVWCFFAALLSAVIYLHFVQRRDERSGPRHMLGTTVFHRSTENSLSDRHSLGGIDEKTRKQNGVYHRRVIRHRQGLCAGRSQGGCEHCHSLSEIGYGR